VDIEGLKVMIVDDNPLNINVLKDTLEPFRLNISIDLIGRVWLYPQAILSNRNSSPCKISISAEKTIIPKRVLVKTVGKSQASIGIECFRSHNPFTRS